MLCQGLRIILRHKHCINVENNFLQWLIKRRRKDEIINDEKFKTSFNGNFPTS